MSRSSAAARPPANQSIPVRFTTPPLPLHRPRRPLSQPHLFPCTVHAVQLCADAKTDEPYATIILTPGPQRNDANPTPDAVQAVEPGFCYYAKQLTQSDANNGGGFSVPRHIYRGTPRRHLLTTGWSKFVNAKLLVAGDVVVFIHRPNGELLAGVRRTPRYPVSPDAGGDTPRNSRARVPPQEVMDSARDAAKGSKFTVTYYPRQGAGEFVVPRKQSMDAEECRFEWINGIVKTVDSSIWRMLECFVCFGWTIRWSVAIWSFSST